MNRPIDNQLIKLIKRVRYREIGGEGVLLHLDNGRVLVVNEVGLHILELLSEPKTKTELSQLISKEFDVSVDQAETDLQQFLGQLDQEQVLEPNPE